jgi:hypothetical protein
MNAASLLGACFNGKLDAQRRDGWYSRATSLDVELANRTLFEWPRLADALRHRLSERPPLHSPISTGICS